MHHVLLTDLSFRALSVSLCLSLSLSPRSQTVFDDAIRSVLSPSKSTKKKKKQCQLL